MPRPANSPTPVTLNIVNRTNLWHSGRGQRRNYRPIDVYRPVEHVPHTWAPRFFAGFGFAIKLSFIRPENLLYGISRALGILAPVLQTKGGEWQQIEDDFHPDFRWPSFPAQLPCNFRFEVTPYTTTKPEHGTRLFLKCLTMERLPSSGNRIPWFEKADVEQVTAKVSQLEWALRSEFEFC